MRYCLSVPNFADAPALVNLAVLAEESGWDGFFLWDHMLVSRTDPPPISDTWTTLGATAMCTSRIRLGSMVTPLPRRRPWVVARQVATLDHLSGGRAVLGVGLGTPADEDFAAFGDEPDERTRAAMLDEAIDVIAGLWTGQPFSYSGEHHSIDDVRFRPRPVQQPRPPIWVGGYWPNPGPFARATRWDGYLPLGTNGTLTPGEVAEIAAAIRGERGDAPFDLAILPEYATMPQAAAEYERAGATWLVYAADHRPDWLEDMRAWIPDGPPRT